MIKYTHYKGTSYVGVYNYDEYRRTYMFAGHMSMEGVKPEIAAALKVATRIHGRSSSIFVDETGNVANAPA